MLLFDETDKIVFTTEQILGKNEKTIEGAFFGNLNLSKIADHIYTDGKYKIILLRKYKDEFIFISNSIDFEVKNKNVVKIN